MNEKEIIEILKRDMFMFSCEQEEAIQGLLDLYNKEKEKNIELLVKLDMKKILFARKDHITKEILCEYYIRKDEIDKDYISKDKIREKIKEIRSNKQYNFVGTEWSESEVVGMLEDLLEE